MSIVSLVHTHHEPNLGTYRQAPNWRKFKNNITIKDWRKVFYLQMLDIIIVNLLEGIPRTLSSMEFLQTVHNAILWLKTRLKNCPTGVSRGLIRNIMGRKIPWTTFCRHGILRWAHVWVVTKNCDGLHTKFYSTQEDRRVW
jgi:hypothetical protein